MFFKKNKPAGPGFFCSAIVAAAGSSTRMGTNKLLMEIDGIPILARTLENLQCCDDIHEIVIACRSEDIVVYSDLAAKYNITKISKIVKGGADRAASVYAGLMEANKRATLAAVHDAARPFASPELMSRIIRLAAYSNAAIPVIPVKDTIKYVEKGVITQTPDRALLHAAQTPQVFDIDLLKGALQKARESGFAVTDDASAVEALGVPVYTAKGDYDNIKITTPEDIAVGEQILARRM